MGRTKEKAKIIHRPSTNQILISLQSIPDYSRLLLANSPDKTYSEFLRWLIDKNFYSGEDHKVQIKQIASDFKSDASKVTKMIKNVYEDIFELNFDHPELFQQDGIEVCLYCKYFDSYCSFYTSLPVLPREHEKINFYFVNAKIGTHHFWIKRVEHEIAKDVVVTLWLDGGDLNRFREYSLEHALFQGHIGFMDTYDKHGFELDDKLRKLYRDQQL